MVLRGVGLYWLVLTATVGGRKWLVIAPVNTHRLLTLRKPATAHNRKPPDAATGAVWSLTHSTPHAQHAAMMPLTPLPTTRGTITSDRMWILNRVPRRSRDFDAGLVRHAHTFARPTLPPMQQKENNDGNVIDAISDEDHLRKMMQRDYQVLLSYYDARRRNIECSIAPCDLRKAITCLALSPSASQPQARHALSRLSQLNAAEQAEALFLSIVVSEGDGVVDFGRLTTTVKSIHHLGLPLQRPTLRPSLPAWASQQRATSMITAPHPRPPPPRPASATASPGRRDQWAPVQHRGRSASMPIGRVVRFAPL